MSENHARGNLPAGAGAPAAPDNRVMLARGLRARCPLCGAGGLFESRFRMRALCPRCGLRLDRGETDFWAGAWMLNLVGVEVVFALLLALAVVIMWPDVPWSVVMWTGVTGMLLLPLLLFRVSRTLWLAIDLALQPARETDFESRTRTAR